MALERNRELALVYLEAVRSADVELMEGLLAPDFVDYMMGVRRSREERLLELRRGLAGIEILEVDTVAEGDKVAVRYAARGLHRGSGKQPTVTGMFILRIAAGKIVEGWGEQDRLGLLQQLGMLPDPPPTR